MPAVIFEGDLLLHLAIVYLNRTKGTHSVRGVNGLTRLPVGVGVNYKCLSYEPFNINLVNTMIGLLDIHEQLLPLCNVRLQPTIDIAWFHVP